MLKSLFTSKTRVELLKLFLFNPSEAFYQRQIATKINIPIRAVQRELGNLLRSSIITCSASGNRAYYSLNNSCPIKDELKKIFFKTTGIATALKAELKKVNDIDIAFIYGSFVKNTENLDSDIDIFIIGDITSRRLSSVLSKEKRILGREINFVTYSKNDFLKKIEDGNHFVLSVLNEKKIPLLGDIDDLTKVRDRKED